MRYSDKIGQQIRSVRESRGYSQEYMAEMLGLCQSSYANLEAGKSILRVDRLLEICAILQMDVHDMFDQTNHKKVDGAGFSEATLRNAEMHPEVKAIYEQLVSDLRSEIEFLRGLIRVPPGHSS